MANEKNPSKSSVKEEFVLLLKQLKEYKEADETVKNEIQDRMVEKNESSENSQDAKRKTLIQKFVKIIATQIELNKAKKAIDKEKDDRTKEEQIEEEIIDTDVKEISEEKNVEINKNPEDKSEALKTVEESKNIKSFGQFLNSLRENAHAHLDNIQNRIDKELEEIKEQTNKENENYKEDDEPER